MTPACLRQTELPHSSRLFTDFLYHFDRVAPFYTAAGRRDGFAEERRAGLVRVLEASNGPSPTLDLLAKPGTAAVVTGQQVGLFSGPAYTIYKALTAAKYAQFLNEQGQPAAPVFWLAAEDHDFAEVNHTWVFDGANRPVKLQVAQPGPAERPVGGISPDSFPIGDLRTALKEHPFGEDVVRLVDACYRPGATMGGAFGALLRKLLEPYGFLFVDPLDPGFRALAEPLLRRAVQSAPHLTRELLARNKQLEDAGYHAQVHIEEKTSLFFLLEGDRRLHLRRAGGDYALNGRRVSSGELADRACSLSPNAALRPVLQDYVLPTAAYVGGPAELAYFAQSQVLYEALEVPMPRLLSRTGFTLLDVRGQKLMERYALRVPDLFHGEQQFREKVAAALVPPEMANRFRDTRHAVSAQLDSLDSVVRGFDATLGAALDKSRAKIAHQLGKIESKAARESMRRESRAGSDAAYLYNGIFPEKHLQERFYGILPFLARHGFDLIGRLYDAVPLDCPDHILLPVS